jgi:hypothetical protein
MELNEPQIKAFMELVSLGMPILYMAEGTVFEDYLELEWDYCGQTICIQIDKAGVTTARVQRKMSVYSLSSSHLVTGEWYPFKDHWFEVHRLLHEFYTIIYGHRLGHYPFTAPVWLLAEAINILKFIRVEGLSSCSGRDDSRNLIRKFLTVIGEE